MEVVIFLTIFASSFIRNGKNHPDTFEKILIFKLLNFYTFKNHTFESTRVGRLYHNIFISTYHKIDSYFYNI